MSGKVFLIEPFYTGSHANWCDQLVAFSNSEVRLFKLSGRHWKWRMAAGAIPLAKMVNEQSDIPKAFMCTDMIDLALFKASLHARFSQIPMYLYMHENQLTYPWQKKEYRDWDRQFAWRNLTSMILADSVVFNSHFHLNSVLDSIDPFLKAFPDKLPNQPKERIEQKSKVIYPGIDAHEILTNRSVKSDKFRILWNHRWEYDKNPEEFYQLLVQLREMDFEFEIMLCGETKGVSNEVYSRIIDVFSNEIVQAGYIANRNEYYQKISTCHILPVFNDQEFFGLSVMEAAFSGVKPLLPKRLSYPELYRGLNVFYDNQEDLIKQILRMDPSQHDFQLPQEFDRFDWSQLIEEYEQLWFHS